MNTKSPWQTYSPINDAQVQLGKLPMLKITLEHKLPHVWPQLRDSAYH